MITHLRLLMVGCLLMLFGGVSLVAEIIYVKPSASSSAWTSQSTVYTDLQDALSAAAYGDEIWVAQGTYYPTSETDRDIYFELVDGVSLLGGFVGTETSSDDRNWSLYPTILSGDIGMVGTDSDNSYHVLSCTSAVDTTTIINGFIVEKGYADSYGDYYGGGMYMSTGEPVIINTIFRDNYAYYDGGAIYFLDGTLLIANSVFYNNNVNDDGGAIYNSKGDLNLLNCIVSNNVASDDGGGLYSYYNANTVITNSIIWANTSLDNYDNIYNSSVTYSCVEDGYSGTGNVSDDPLFIDILAGDFRLDTTSPCIDAGINDSIPDWLSYDFGIDARILDITVDMGIYEGGVVCPLTLTPESEDVMSGSDTGNLVEFTAGWEAGEEPYIITRYFIQYWEEGGDTTSVDISSDLSYSNSFESGVEILWRVGVETEDGDINYSQINIFYITHSHPLYVKQGASGDGTSWEDAYGDLQDALGAAVYSEEIWVAEGTYYPTSDTDRSVSFELVNGVSVLGGFAGTETSADDRDWNLYPTILSGDIGTVDTDSDNSCHVLRCASDVDTTTIINGFSIENGYANYYSSMGYESYYAGGMYILDGEPVVINVIFKDNYSTLDGGAVYVASGSPLFINSVFYDNNTISSGGAMYNSSGEVTLTNCVISNNNANSYGGGIYSMYSSNLTLVNSIVWGNTASGSYDDIYNASVTYSCVEEGYTGTGNVSEDPLFIDASAGDFRLAASSLCIDAGINDSIPEWLSYDFAKNTRILDVTVDMGIYEGGVVCPLTLTPEDGDVMSGSDAGNLVEFTAGWEAGEEPYTITRYFIQYWQEGDDTTSVDISSDLSYSSTLDAGVEILWRVGVETEDGDINYSQINIFYINHSYPLYVKEGGSGDGTSWGSAYGDLQDALGVAIYSDEIWVAQGTYYPTSGSDSDVSFELVNGVSLFGGFAGTETSTDDRDWNLYPTILSGDIGTIGTDADNSYHVLSCTSSVDTTTIVNGFVIEKGYADYWSDKNYFGGGMCILDGAPVIVNAVFKDNYCNYDGGAVYVYEGTPLFINSIFYDNYANDDGGAIYSSRADMTLVNCVMSNNESVDDGGGLYSYYNASTVIANSIVWGNTASGSYNNIFNSTVTYSCVEEGYTGTGNISDDPSFYDEENRDFHLISGSLCINAGINDSIPDWIDVDMDNSARIIAEAVDMGVYETSYATAISTIKSSDVSVYPNPVTASSMVTVDFGGSVTTGTIRLFEINGKIIYKDEFSNSANYYLSETNLQPGIYILELVNDGEISITKLVIER